ncbi:MAG: LD-carboxypeptidase [Victivallales bacterium]|nr:LD-carboxypeptidase [Victivallales bacterium]
MENLELTNPFPKNIRTVGVFSLSSKTNDGRRERGLARLASWGLSIQEPPLSTPPVRNLAASDAARAEQFNALLADDTVDALMGMRGGYGVTRLLERLDWETLRRRNLPVIGYSDVSALHLVAWAHGGRNQIHGPMVYGELGRAETGEAMRDSCNSLGLALAGTPFPILSHTHLETLRPGHADGQVVPVNLSLLQALLGTPWMPDLSRCILAVEDIHEPAHAIDRIFTQLASAGVLKRLAGLMLGQFIGGEDAEYLPGLFREVAGQIQGPVVAGVHFGHGWPSMSIRVGGEIEVNATPEEATVRTSALDSYESVVEEAGGRLRGYCLLRPREMERGRRYPLILMLHGAGERGEDNRRQLIHVASRFVRGDARSKFPCFVLAPQCPAGEQWVNTPWRITEHPQGEISRALSEVLPMLDHVCGSNPVDLGRLYLVGLSMGGYGVWDLATRFPQRWAGMVSLCGGGDVKQAPRLANLPIWAFHGEKDNVVPPVNSVEMVEAVNAAGGQARLTLFPDAWHDCWNPAMEVPGVLEWLFAQKK